MLDPMHANARAPQRAISFLRPESGLRRNTFILDPLSPCLPTPPTTGRRSPAATGMVRREARVLGRIDQKEWHHVGPKPRNEAEPFLPMCLTSERMDIWDGGYMGLL